jgi:trk system potassium uptake protein TrkA
MSKHKYAVIGLGTFGSTVARELERLGNEVIGIDTDESRVGPIAAELSHAVTADARDERVLRELGLAEHDGVVVAIGEDLEANILCTLALKSLGVRSVWVKALSPVHHRILEQLGADRIVNPEQHVGLHVARTMIYPNVLDYISLGGDDYIVEIDVPDSLDGKPLPDLQLAERYQIEVAALKREGQPATVKALQNCVLRSADRLVLLGTLSALRRFGREHF